MYELLGVSGGAAGVLEPGEKGRIEVLFQPINGATRARSNFQLIAVNDDAEPLDFAGLETELRPARIAADAWDAIFTNFIANIGDTTGDYRHALAENASHLGQFGPVSADTTRLVDFELQQAADFGAVEQRFLSGAFGRGSAGPFALRATTAADGTVTLSDGNVHRSFEPLTRGGFAGVRGDGATLTRASDGTFTLTEVFGDKAVFRASDGRLDFTETTTGVRTTAAWNASGQLVSITNSLNDDVTTFTHNAQGHIATMTDAVGRVTTYGYDAGGEHLTSITDARGSTAYTYTATGHAVASITGLDGVTTTYSHDASGRVTSITTGSGPGAITTTLSHDSTGGVIFTDAAGKTTRSLRADGGAVARLTNPDGEFAGLRLDSAGRVAGVVDATGLAGRTVNGADGILDAIVSPDGTRTSFDIGGPQRLVNSVTDASGDTTRYEYDAQGKLLATIMPDGFGSTYEYDTKGRIVATTNANGERLTLSYDAAGLITSRTLPDGTVTTYTYDTHRNMLTAADPGGTTTFTYDAADRITSAAYPNGKTVTLTYDAAGRRATISDGAYTVKYSYDALGRLDTLRDGADALLVDYGYNALGKLTSETRGNGATTAYAYSDAGFVASITHRDAANTVTGFFNYTYAASGRVESVATEDGTTTYGYDLAGQLVSATLPGGRTLTFAYDTEGNRTSTSDTATGTENYTTDSTNAYTAAGAETLVRDLAGRLIARSEGGVTESYDYDAAGRLLTIVSPGSIVAYDYDALGNRIGKTVNGVRTDFAMDPDGLTDVFGEYQGAATVANYAHGLGLAARATAGGAQFYHFDAVGNTSQLTGAGGTSVATYDYLPFGEIAAQTGGVAQPFTFGGLNGVQDDEGALYYMRARTFDAELGRFTTRDPIGFSGGDVNWYRFAGNDPVSGSDPGGLQGEVFGGNSIGINLPTRPGAKTVVQGLGKTVTGLGKTGLSAAAKATFPLGKLVINNAPTVGTVGVETVASGAVGAEAAVANAVVSQTGLGIEASVGGLESGFLEAGAAVGSGALRSSLLTLGKGLLKGGLQGLAADLTGKYIAAPAVIGFYKWADDSAQNLFHNDPEADKSHFSPEFVKKWSKNPYFTDIVKKGIQDGLSQDDAILDAIRILKKLGLDKEGGESTTSEVVRPSDPNNIIGPFGAGADPVPDIIAPGQVRFDGFVNDSDDFAYTIQFENQPSANAPAQVVRVTQTLDADLDLTTFRFGTFGWGEFKVSAPAAGDGTSFHTIVDATAALGVNVQVDAELNAITRELTVVFTSLDPATNDVPFDPFAGFLPPDDATGRGDGFLTYTIAPKSGLANATDFTGIANIVFDTEDALATPTVTNTLDIIAPDSAVTPFASATTSRLFFPVRWTGADDAGGSGLAGITLSFTDNDGPLQTATFANADGGFRFPGEVGHTYKFFSQAVDNVGNTETLAALPDAQITVVAPTLISNKDGAKLRVFTDEDGDTYTVALTGPGTLNVVLLDPDNDGKGTIDQLFLTGSTVKSKVTVAVKRAKDGPDVDKLPDGDGIVSIGDINVTGDLGSFTAKASDLTVDGILASGFIGAVSVRDMISADVFAGTPGITSIGTALTKTKFTLLARNIGDGDFNIGNPAASIKAASIGDASITAPSLGKLTTTLGAMNADLDITGNAGPITVKLGANAGTWTAANFGAITLGGSLDANVASAGSTGVVTLKAGNINGDIDVAGKITNASVKAGSINGQLTAATIGPVSITGGGLGGFIGSNAAPGKVKGLTSLTISGGSLTGSVLVNGNSGPITVKENKAGVGGNISGPITANSFGAVTLLGGSLSGALNATGTALALGKTLALAGLNITGGDLLADVRLFGGAGAVSVKTDKAGNGGNITDINITATKIAALTVARDITDSIIMAGADLGDDHELGGGDDTFGVGTIGAVNIGSKVGAVTFGNVVNSVIAAGLSTTNATLKDGDDTLLGITPTITSKIASLIVKGSADSASYFATGKFTAKPKIGAIFPDVTTDGRFKVA